MITREEAERLAGEAHPGPWTGSEGGMWAGFVHGRDDVAEVYGPRGNIHLIAAAPDLARTVVALYEEMDRFNIECADEITKFVAAESAMRACIDRLRDGWRTVTSAVTTSTAEERMSR